MTDNQADVLIFIAVGSAILLALAFWADYREARKAGKKPRDPRRESLSGDSAT